MACHKQKRSEGLCGKTNKRGSLKKSDANITVAAASHSAYQHKSSSYVYQSRLHHIQPINTHAPSVFANPVYLSQSNKATNSFRFIDCRQIKSCSLGTLFIQIRIYRNKLPP
jgi:hypothetical protein